MKEIWRDIPNYEGLYQASTIGRIKRIYKNGSEKILKLYPHNSGYLQVALCKDGKRKNCLVHVLVALTFIPNPENKPKINHKDTNKMNNVVDLDDLYGETTNLEWNTQAENVQHAWKNGLCRKKFGATNQHSKQVLQYDLQGNFIKKWDTVTEASSQNNIWQGNISNCCRGRYKSSGGYIWRYANENN